MKPAPYTYHAPKSIGEALDLLATLDNARVLAGGQSLVPMLNFRVTQPDHLIDLGRIPELVFLDEAPDGLRIGAMTTQRAIERSTLVGERCPLLIDALFHVGHQQTRNRGTLGGSLCHLDPAAELPVAACALDPLLTIRSRSGHRQIPFSEFPASYLTSSLATDEILVEVTFRPLPQGTGTAFAEFACRPADFAIVSVAAVVTVTADQISEAAIALGGVGPVPVRLATVEAALRGCRIDEELIEHAATMAADWPSEGDDLYPAEYRQELAGFLTRQALSGAISRSRSAHE
jgi:aerobic carbon-monoxide dehydrogenase medium subunit